jgi:hypothetical protein
VNHPEATLEVESPYHLSDCTSLPTVRINILHGLAHSQIGAYFGSNSSAWHLVSNSTFAGAVSCLSVIWSLIVYTYSIWTSKNIGIATYHINIWTDTATFKLKERQWHHQCTVRYPGVVPAWLWEGLLAKQWGLEMCSPWPPPRTA